MRIRVRVWLNVAVVCGLTAIGLAGPVCVRAQDVGKILSQYAKAEGGGKLSKITTLKLEGTVTASGGAGGNGSTGAAAKSSGGAADTSPGAYTFETKLPNRYYSEMVAGDRSWIEAFNGKSAWRQNARGEIGTLVGPEGLQVEAAARYYNTRLLNPKKYHLLVTYVGTAQVRGREAVEIQVTAASGAQRRTFFDAQTHLIVKEEATVGGVQQEIYYSDYRPVDGVQVPYKIELHRGTEAFDIDVTHAAINEPVGERTFDFPRKAQVVLPDLKALFAKIDANQKAIDKMKEDYAGTKVEEETEFDGNGKSKKREVLESTFFYLNGSEVSTLVKRDGQPLSDEEKKKEEARVLKEIETLQKEADKKDKKEEKTKDEGKDADEDDVSMETFLRACQFVNPRRERFRGADVLVFDFEPNPEYKARNLMEKMIQKLGGVIWVDEKALDVARLDAFFVSDAKIAGGMLADVEKGTRIILEQEFLNNEVWLPTYESVHVDVKVLLVKSFHVDETTRYSDYKKFNVATIATIGKPKGVEGDAATTPGPSGETKPQ